MLAPCAPHALWVFHDLIDATIHTARSAAAAAHVAAARDCHLDRLSTHLYQVLPKLGITSRAALRDALADTSPEEGRMQSSSLYRDLPERGIVRASHERGGQRDANCQAGRG